MALNVRSFSLFLSILMTSSCVPPTEAHVLASNKRAADQSGMNEDHDSMPHISGEVLNDVPWAPSGTPPLFLDGGQSLLETLSALQRVMEMSKAQGFIRPNSRPNRHIDDEPPRRAWMDPPGNSEDPSELAIKDHEPTGKIQPRNTDEFWDEAYDADDNTAHGLHSWWDHLARMSSYFTRKGEGGDERIIGLGETVARKKQLPKNGSRFIPRLGRRR